MARPITLQPIATPDLSNAVATIMEARQQVGDKFKEIINIPNELEQMRMEKEKNQLAMQLLQQEAYKTSPQYQQDIMSKLQNAPTLEEKQFIADTYGLSGVSRTIGAQINPEASKTITPTVEQRNWETYKNITDPVEKAAFSKLIGLTKEEDTSSPLAQREMGITINPVTNKPYLENENTNYGFAQTMTTASQNINQLSGENEAAVAIPSQSARDVKGGIMSAFKQAVQKGVGLDANWIEGRAYQQYLNMLTPPQQQYENDKNAWIRAKLRKESGAAIGQDEFLQEERTFFPIYGDSPEVIEQKRQKRLEIDKTMRERSGSGRVFEGTGTEEEVPVTSPTVSTTPRKRFF